MTYDIHITATAERDILNASDHIEFSLKNPKAADDLLDEVDTKINSLSDFPQRFQIVENPILASWEIRFIIVKNYLAFYVISEETNQVIVVRFLFQKSNWTAILRQGFPLV
jgi:plasmid stabilization system protein ParE